MSKSKKKNNSQDQYVRVTLSVGRNSKLKFIRLKFPRNKLNNKKDFEYAKKQIRKLARDIGVPFISFRPTHDGVSKYNIKNHHILISTNNKNQTPQKPIVQLFHALHEISHYLDHIVGHFKKFYDIKNRTEQDLKKVAYRAECHADWLARRIMIAMFQLDPGEQKYDKEFLYQYYGWS